MLSILLFAAAWVACLAQSNEFSSYSSAIGLGAGTPFSAKGEGSITGVKVWEHPNSHITGIQLRHGANWGSVLGIVTTSELSMELFEGEAIVQVSGKFNPVDYIYQLTFRTNRGRSLIAGQPFQVSFNFYPKFARAELRMLSGRSNDKGITSLGAHWGIVNPQGNTGADQP
ncbi:zymogen granule membrane protein 16 [Gadus morhua]|uniref:Zymogen granule membrane protein 16-like n=1 Tax=Gadus morhua TaxID=8049 RepID=A0A8C5F9Q8_GADMO|nr:zymogen granule membrane protein 16-like [Gadus morhua]